MTISHEIPACIEQFYKPKLWNLSTSWPRPLVGTGKAIHRVRLAADFVEAADHHALSAA